MSTTRIVTIVPPIVAQAALNDVLSMVQKKRVAAYARVSTDDPEQLTSYDAQKDYYTNYIKSKDEWIFAGMFADKDRSGTTTKGRDDFNRMIKLAMDGEIDLIITKSISRFARNTVDTLTTVRKLKAKGVEVYFEKENLYTLDPKVEVVLTIMSSLAQEESRSISENVTWGQRKRFADGKVSLPYKQFLGYKKGANNLPEIVDEEAKTVRLIYKLFLQGRTYNAIRKYLEDEGVPSPAGKKRWYVGTIISILTNEKYMGDAILQKTFTVDFLTKTIKKNEGEVPQYYVRNSHPAIISAEVFAMAQAEFARRDAMMQQPCGTGPFSGKLLCADCGDYLGGKQWHSDTKYARTVWRCFHKHKDGHSCRTRHVHEDSLRQAFVEVFNRVYFNRKELREDARMILVLLTDTTSIDREMATLQDECAVVMEMLRKAVADNTAFAQDQKEYQRRYEALVDRYEAAKDRLGTLENEHQSRIARSAEIEWFLSELDRRDTILTAFDEELWYNTVESVHIGAGDEITFTFRGGTKEIVKLEVERRCVKEKNAG